MALIENLVVALGLRSSQFSSGMKKAQSELTGFEKATSAIGSKLMAFGKMALVAFVGFESIRGVINSLSESMNRLFSQSMSAAKLGIPIEDFTAFAFAVGSVGIEVEKFDTAMQKMFVTLANAAEGDKSAIGVLNTLGIAADKIVNASFSEQVMILAKGFEKINNAAQRMDLARGIFGRGGAGMLNIMGQGTKALQDMLNTAKRFGVVISAMDMSKIIELRTSWFYLKQAMHGVWNTLLITLAPALTVVFNKITDLIVRGREWAIEFVNGVNVMNIAIGFLYNSLMLIVDVMSVLIHSTAIWASMLYASVSFFTGEGQKGADFWMGIAEMNVKAQKAALEDIKKIFEGKYVKELEDLIKRLKGKVFEGKEGDFLGGAERVGAGAFEMRSKEAVEAAFKAGGDKEALNYQKQGVIKLSELSIKADAIDAKMLAISNLLGLDAGIV